MVSNKQKRMALDLVYPIVKEDDTQNFASLSYVDGISETIAKYFRNWFNYNISFKTRNNLSTFIKNNKDRTNKDNKSGVYKLTCNDCPMVYVGQTGRSFKKRIQEHQRSYRLDSTHSTYANHLNELGHSFNNNYEIIHVENKSSRLTLLESLEINRYNARKILLNEQIDVDRSPLLNIFL